MLCISGTDPGFPAGEGSAYSVEGGEGAIGEIRTNFHIKAIYEIIKYSWYGVGSELKR